MTLSVLFFLGISLLVCFVVIFGARMLVGEVRRLGCARTTTLVFTAVGNNFELAIAIATFGTTSGQALTGMVGPLIEVSLLVAPAYAALFCRKFFPETAPRPAVLQPR